MAKGGKRKAEEQSATSVFRLPLFQGYWIAVPPDGDAVSLPLDPIEDVPCQMVPVVLVKKYRVPVDVESGSAQA